MDFLGDYIVLLVLGICLCVGYILKFVVPGEAVNRFIPLFMGLLGVVLNGWINLALTPEIVLGGLVSGLASTGMYELFSQFIKRKNNYDREG